jgi:iron complex transport system ATP-binding protein
VLDVVLDLRIERLARERHVLLHDIAWTVRRGEHWAIVGPNGSGKTTLVRVLAGYLWPSRGEVTVLGQRFGEIDVRELRKAIGIVSSSLVEWLPPDLDARATVATGFEASLGGGHAPIGDSQLRRADDALSAVGAAAIAARPYGVLSQGERQRVMIARALVHEPALLILDEPCAGLDPVARERFVNDLATLITSGRAPSLVLVTHHLEEIPPRITHALALRSGTAVASGPLTDVLTEPVMSRVFDARCSVRRDGARWSMSFA